MVAVMCARPQAKHIYLSQELKDRLQHRFTIPAVLDELDLDFLRRASEAGVQDASLVMDMIKEYGKVEVWIEY